MLVIVLFHWHLLISLNEDVVLRGNRDGALVLMESLRKLTVFFWLIGWDHYNEMQHYQERGREVCVEAAHLHGVYSNLPWP